MTIDYTALFIQFPIIGIIAVIALYFYPKLREDSKATQAQLINLTEKTTEAITNNTAVMTHLVAIIERLENKK